METAISQKRLGSNVDSWCGKCKLMLAHTIEAMVGDKPTRVICNTCKSQHAYKARQPGESASKSKSSDSEEKPVRRTRPSSNRYQTLLKSRGAEAVKHYSPQGKYEAGDVLDHPTFGRGVTTAVREGTKIEVLFEAGPKTLIHSR